jgi:hypothetical protein
MRREVVMLLVLLVISEALFYHPVSANYGMGYKINTTATCENFVIKGRWSDEYGLQIVFEGSCTIEFLNPTNTGIKDKLHVFNNARPEYWNNVQGIVSIIPDKIECPQGWIAPGEPVKMRIHFERGRIRPVDVFRIAKLKFFRWRGSIDWEVSSTVQRDLPLWFRINVEGTGRIVPDWLSIFLVLSVHFMWIIVTLVGLFFSAIMRKKDESTKLGAGLALSYSYIISYLSVFFTLSLIHNLLLLALLSLMFISLWTSLVNRTTPKKPKEVERLLGNIALIFVALAVVTALIAAYIQKSSAMGFGLLVFIVLLEFLFTYATEKTVGMIEEKGKIPQMKTEFLVVTVLAMNYPVVATSVLAKRLDVAESSILIGLITVLLGFSIEKIARTKGFTHPEELEEELKEAGVY